MNATLPAASALRPILVAETKRIDSELFRTSLERAGLQNPLHTVHTGDEAIEYLDGRGRYVNREEFPLPDLLLLDPNLHGKSGWEVLVWLRERPEFGSLVVIMSGGSGSRAEEDMAYRLGVNHYHLSLSSGADLDNAIKRIFDLRL
jgi:CheY-like chemotaxis protein